MHWGTKLTAAAAILAASACNEDPTWPGDDIQYREEMRSFVEEISGYARAEEPGFIVVAQNGIELLTLDGEQGGPLVTEYLQALSGQAQEDLFYGYVADDEPTPEADVDWMLPFLLRAEQQGVEVMAVDYCWTPAHVDSSYQLGQDNGFVSFAADSRDLDDVPPYPPMPWQSNPDSVHTLADAHNFLYLINDQGFASKDQFISTLAGTNYDVFVIDLFCAGQQLDASDLAQLENKPAGGSRLVLCYMSIGEAEDYRWYWDPGWEPGWTPGWLGGENPDWPGNYLVEYWVDDWQAIIFGSDSSYTDMILAAGFDGVYMDKIDAFEDWENR